MLCSVRVTYPNRARSWSQFHVRQRILEAQRSRNRVSSPPNSAHSDQLLALLQSRCPKVTILQLVPSIAAAMRAPNRVARRFYRIICKVGIARCCCWLGVAEHLADDNQALST